MQDAPHAISRPSLVDHLGQPLRSNRHHRRPRSRGGHLDEWNKAIVKPVDHILWHMLAQNFWATVIIRQFNAWKGQTFQSVRGPKPHFICVPSPNARYLADRIAQQEILRAESMSISGRMTRAQERAWHQLFGRNTHPAVVVQRLHLHWLDRDYEVKYEYR